MEGAEAGGASGIDHAVGAAEVEAVGDAAGHDITQKAGEGVLGPLGVVGGDAGDGVLDAVGGNASLEHGAPPLGVVEPRAEGDEEFKGAGDADDDAGALAQEGLAGLVGHGGVAGVAQGLAGGEHAQELGGVGGLEAVGGDAEFRGVEGDRVEEGAAAGVDHVRSLWVRMEVVVGTPAVGRDLADAIDAGEQGVPETLVAGLAGEQA